jgi:hypothetical protein
MQVGFRFRPARYRPIDSWVTLEFVCGGIGIPEGTQRKEGKLNTGLTIDYTTIHSALTLSQYVNRRTIHMFQFRSNKDFYSEQFQIILHFNFQNSGRFLSFEQSVGTSLRFPFNR